MKNSTVTNNNGMDSNNVSNKLYGNINIHILLYNLQKMAD